MGCIRRGEGKFCKESGGKDVRLDFGTLTVTKYTFQQCQMKISVWTRPLGADTREAFDSPLHRSMHLDTSSAPSRRGLGHLTL